MNTTWKKYKEFIILGIFGALVFLLVLVLLYPERDKIIQSELIVILVFITLYYAIQTRKLVEEGKKKTKIDFWERRIDEFYSPFIEKVNIMKKKLHKEPVDFDGLNEIMKNTYYLFWNKRRMTSKETAKKISKLMLDTFIAGEHRKEEDFKKYYEIERDVRKIILREWDDIETQIRKFYGY